MHGGVTAKMKTSTGLCEVESDGEPPRPFQCNRTMLCFSFRIFRSAAIDTPSGKRAITEPLVDAIVVPTIRTAEHLRSAVQFAADTRCHLIVIYTDSPPAGLSDVLDALGPSHVTVLTVRSGVRDRLLDLGASLPQNCVSPAALDISRKAQSWFADRSRLRMDPGVSFWTTIFAS